MNSGLAYTHEHDLLSFYDPIFFLDALQSVDSDSKQAFVQIFL